MTAPAHTPALVSHDAARRLPRPALWLFCAAYVLPGLFGRDPWRNADQTAFGYMLAIAEGRTPWWAPTLGGLPPDNAVLPHWLGAAGIALLSPWLGAPVAARVPFGLLLAGVLILTWYACYHLARTEAAQPVAFAFGGEAGTVDYARAIADGSLLALIATLGLLQLGHETTPELVQLFAAALALWGLAAAPHRDRRSRLAIVVGLPLLAASGAPMMALLFGMAAVGAIAQSGDARLKRFARWTAAGTAIAALSGFGLGTWAWRIGFETDAEQLLRIARLFLWFLWPSWLLVLWTLWRWRHHWAQLHIAVPSALAAVAVVACVAGGGFDRALMIGLPGFAVLAAFAMPTLRRGAAAAIDWFSVFFFSTAAIAIWVIYAAMITGVPAKPAANVAKLAPGFEMPFSWPALALGALATLAWLGLVRWRTGRHRAALWKSLVLPAGGVALAWLLLTTLWLPLLDYARSNRPWVARIAPHVPSGSCVAAPGLPRPSIAALEQYGRWQVVARDDVNCAVMLRQERRSQEEPAPAGWEAVARVSRPTDRDEMTQVLRRRP